MRNPLVDRNTTVEVERRGREFVELTSDPEVRFLIGKGYEIYYWSWKKNSIIFYLWREATIQEKIKEKESELEQLKRQLENAP